MNTTRNNINKIKNYLEFGMRLSVTIKFGPKDEYSLHCNLIGMKDNQFLLLDLSQKSVEDLITRKTSNVGVVVRGITDTDLGHIIAFKSQIITVTSRPTWLMFIKLPYNFESKPIRANKRFKLKLPVAVSFEENIHQATLRDLSTSGCGIYFDSIVELTKESQITIEPKLEYFPKDSPLCHIVNIRRHNGGMLVGVRFENEIEIEDNLKYEILDLAFSH